MGKSFLSTQTEGITADIDAYLPTTHPSDYGPSRSLPSGSTVENLQAALAEIADDLEA